MYVHTPTYLPTEISNLLQPAHAEVVLGQLSNICITSYIIREKKGRLEARRVESRKREKWCRGHMDE
jgi:hypothetical protein